MPLHPLIIKKIKERTLVETAWKGYANKCIPPNAPEKQFTEMRKAFFCGFFACFDVMGQVAINQSEEEADVTLTGIKEECEREIKKFANFEAIQ